MAARGPFVEVPVACWCLIGWIFRENAGLTVNIFLRWELVRFYVYINNEVIIHLLWWCGKVLVEGISICSNWYSHWWSLGIFWRCVHAWLYKISGRFYHNGDPIYMWIKCCFSPLFTWLISQGWHLTHPYFYKLSAKSMAILVSMHWLDGITWGVEVRYKAVSVACFLSFLILVVTLYSLLIGFSLIW